ncbi:MAG: hypothetical protein IKC94_05475 [Lentisphaeria bacterium]|nr:hypothetical protein [Lentisphaeria bacterium]
MKSFHFVGVGGIGMSALAAGAAARGYEVSGSDRGAEKSENAPLINALKSQQVKIFAQDGSRFAAGNLPDALVYSTAIEEDNPDFQAAGNIRRMHRSEFLRLLLEESGKRTIAVSGSCGKSSVTAFITETLERLGSDPEMISGALSKRYRRADNAGNYRCGRGKYLVFEADESDKSLLAYGADYAVILNIGTDHYDQAELARVFGEFLKNIRIGAVISRQVADALAGNVPAHLQIAVFDGVPGSVPDEYALAEYLPGREPQAVFADGVIQKLPASGRHVALNVLAIRALCAMLGFEDRAVRAALEKFDGVWRRNDYLGMTPAGTMVFDDYAHNPEKIISCLSGMRETVSGRLLAVFQPHGYKPFGFMAGTLFEKLDVFLHEDDRFILLEPFYAGGTSSFSPHAADVCAKWREKSALPERFMVMPDRETLKKFILENGGKNDIAVIMGARDNSLNLFAAELTGLSGK